MSLRNFRLRAVLVAGAMGAALSGCVQSEQDLAEKRISGSAQECRGQSDAACYFRNSPVRLLSEKVIIPGRSLEFFPLAEELEFIDGENRTWIAPKRTLTDGASIPDVFISIIGNPTDPEFANAAALHDAYCGIGNEEGPVYKSRRWQDVHRLFYDGLIVGGTPEIKAKIMFAAVWLGGPRWYPKSRRADTVMQKIPAALMHESLRDTELYINRSNPPMGQLVAYLNWHEQRMKKIAFGGSGPQPEMIEDEVSPIEGHSGQESAVLP